MTHGSRDDSCAVYFATASDFRSWLEANHAVETELLVGMHKAASGVPSMSWSESVDEALCFGWIDGVRRRVDDTRYTIRFTPRRRGGVWSRINVAKVEALRSAGRMTPAGEAAYDDRREDRTAVYSYEQQAADVLPEIEASLRAVDRAWEFFDAQPPSYRAFVVHWVATAKRPETRRRRLEQLVEASAHGRRV